MSESEKSAGKWVRETSAESFDEDVFQQSQQVPVIVDFWAEWCAPCRMLGPTLESLADEFAGKFVLVKAETERVPEAASRFQVQSIPAVYAVCGGEIVEAFVGALPEPQIRSWLERVLVYGQMAQASQAEQSDPPAAEAIYREVIENLPNEADASIGLARVLAAQGRHDEALSVIETLEKRGFLEPEAEKVKASLQLGGLQKLDVESCREAAAADPDDLQQQLVLAEALAGDAQYEEALEIALSLVERDRHGTGEAARKIMVDIFRVLPDQSDLTATYRRKLSMALY